MAGIEFPPDGSAQTSNPLLSGLASRTLAGRERAKAGKAGKVDFRAKLREAAVLEDGGAEGAELARGSVEELLDEVHLAGDALKKDPGMGAIKRYRDAVRSFVGHVVDRSYGVEEHSSGINILKRKKFTLVTVIDHKLDSLAAEILSGQRDQFEILRRLEEINGLLVDLFR